MSCLSAGGTWLGHAPSAKVLEAFHKLRETERKPGAVAVPELDPSQRMIPPPPEGGLVLRVHARFLSPRESGGLRYAQGEDFPLTRGDPAVIRNMQFLLSPNTEYMWLTREEWRALAPANPKIGDTMPAPSAISERMARFHLVPRRALTSEDGILPKKAVKATALTLVVEDVSPERVRLRLEGFVHTGSDYDAAKATTPNGALPFGFATPLHGILEYDGAKKAFVRFDIVAPGEVWGRWGDANNNSLMIERPGRSPIGFAFELAKGDSPTDRIPPAGHGGRALRSGYFGAQKEEPPKLIVRIDAAGKLTIGKEAFALNELKERLVRVMKTATRPGVVEIHAAAQTPYVRVVELMDELRRGGCKDVRLQVRED